jgi:glycosyltransferase involved in cell wall biosynthesis
MFVLTSAVRGGVEEVVLRLAQRLPPGEFSVAIAAPRPLLAAFEPDLRAVPVATCAVAAESWWQRAEVRRLGAFIDAFEPDVVNAHLFRSVVVAAPLARWRRVPAVVETYHGREAWRTGRLRGSFLPDRLLARCLDRVIAVSEAARDFLVRVKRYPAPKVVVVPNGRDLSVFTPGRSREAARKELGADPSTPLVGVVGRLEAQKGHVHLLDAWPDVVAEFPDARLVVIGDGSLRTDLERRARERGIAACVTFTGFREDVWRLLDAVDVVVLPSLHEGMPLTAIEAAAMARPIVATAVDGTPEVVVDGATGVLVPPADARALAAGVRALLRDPGRARAMGAAARRRALERFDLDRHVAATARVYRDVLGARRS